MGRRWVVGAVGLGGGTLFGPRKSASLHREEVVKKGAAGLGSFGGVHCG